ncbi:hypothetical protein S23A_0210705, partial [Aggregatibacter actinomycetemcomitans serotype b str. S23A]
MTYQLFKHHLVALMVTGAISVNALAKDSFLENPSANLPQQVFKNRVDIFNNETNINENKKDIAINKANIASIEKDVMRNTGG